MKHFALLLLTVILTACAPAPATESVSNPVPTPTDDPALLPTLFPNTAGGDDLSRLDAQGAVIVEVTPLNLGTPADMLEFDVAMNTHYVDLSMNLAQLATLSTNSGVTVQASKWDATPAGHHVQGKLIFPLTADGTSILEGADKLTLTIVNVDAASRVFEWELK